MTKQARCIKQSHFECSPWALLIVGFLGCSAEQNRPSGELRRSENDQNNEAEEEVGGEGGNGKHGMAAGGSRRMAGVRIGSMHDAAPGLVANNMIGWQLYLDGQITTPFFKLAQSNGF